jgi:hypothetical protein
MPPLALVMTTVAAGAASCIGPGRKIESTVECPFVI